MFVDDDHLAVLNHVVHVALEQEMGLEGSVDVVQQTEIGGRVKRVVLVEKPDALQFLFDELVAALGQFDLALLFVDEEVAGLLRLRFVARKHRRQAAFDLLLTLQPRGQLVDLHVEIGARLRRSRDDERRPRLVDQDRVHLVHDGEVEGSLGTVPPW